MYQIIRFFASETAIFVSLHYFSAFNMIYSNKGTLDRVSKSNCYIISEIKRDIC